MIIDELFDTILHEQVSIVKAWSHPRDKGRPKGYCNALQGLRAVFFFHQSIDAVKAIQPCTGAALTASVQRFKFALEVRLGKEAAVLQRLSNEQKLFVYQHLTGPVPSKKFRECWRQKQVVEFIEEVLEAVVEGLSHK